MSNCESWIVKHWRLWKILGLSLVASFFAYMIVASYLEELRSAVAFVPIVVFLGWQMFYQSEAAEFFSKITVLFHNEATIDFWRFTISIGKKHITYHFAASPYSF